MFATKEVTFIEKLYRMGEDVLITASQDDEQEMNNMNISKKKQKQKRSESWKNRTWREFYRPWIENEKAAKLSTRKLGIQIR